MKMARSAEVSDAKREEAVRSSLSAATRLASTPSARSTTPSSRSASAGSGGDENDRRGGSALLQCPQQVDAARTGHCNVKEDAPRGFATQAQQEFTRTSVADGAVAADAQDAQHAGAEAVIVVDDVNGRLCPYRIFVVWRQAGLDKRTGTRR
jgi:hypothetical protein